MVHRTSSMAYRSTAWTWALAQAALAPPAAQAALASPPAQRLPSFRQLGATSGTLSTTLAVQSTSEQQFEDRRSPWSLRWFGSSTRVSMLGDGGFARQKMARCAWCRNLDSRQLEEQPRETTPACSCTHAVRSDRLADEHRCYCRCNFGGGHAGSSTFRFFIDRGSDAHPASG